MTLNLTNPITEKLTVEQLAGQSDDCYSKRIGYEVIADDEVFALIPQAAKEDTAKIGEIVTVGSFGIPRRARVIRVLSGFENNYTDQRIAHEDESTYQIHESSYSKKSGIHDRNFKIQKKILQ